jgi:hypothetical protein
MSSALLMLETTAGITAARPLQKSMLHMPHAAGHACMNKQALVSSFGIA